MLDGKISDDIFNFRAVLISLMTNFRQTIRISLKQPQGFTDTPTTKITNILSSRYIYLKQRFTP